MLLTALTDSEFLRHAQAEHEPLIASSIEVELLRRFGDTQDTLESTAGLRTVLDEYDITEAAALRDLLELPGDWGGKPINVLTDALDAEEMTHGLLAQALALQNVCLEFDIDTPDALRKVLERDGKVTQILADITQPINTLAELANAQ